MRTLLFIMFLELSTYALAKETVKWRGHGGWNIACHYCTGFDLNNLTSISGTIEKVALFTPASSMRPGVHLQLNTGKEVIWVHLGPSWFIENQEVKLERFDKINVRGVRAAFNGVPILVAFSVEKGDQVLVLRDNDGRPFWMGWRRGGMDDKP